MRAIILSKAMANKPTQIHSTYPPANKCVYCGATNGDLSREHIIPFALGGNLVIPKASCESCRKITHRFETTCLRVMFGNYRIAADLPSRHKDKRPDILTMPVISLDGQLVGKTEIAARDYPRLLYLPTFPRPSILLGQGPPETVQIRLWTATKKDDVGKIPVYKTSTEQGISGSVPTQAFCRMLAKIAHCFAFVKMREMKDNDFEPLLPAYIRDATGSPFYLIGCPDRSPPRTPGALHSLECRLRRSAGTEVLYVNLRLFAGAGAPVYEVVAGRRSLR